MFEVEIWTFFDNPDEYPISRLFGLFAHIQNKSLLFGNAILQQFPVPILAPRSKAPDPPSFANRHDTNAAFPAGN